MGEKELEETDQKITDTTEEIVKNTSEITTDEGEQVEEKKELEKVTRRELRQKCAVMFPTVFTQFTKQKSPSQRVCAHAKAVPPVSLKLLYQLMLQKKLTRLCRQYDEETRF